MDTKKWLKTFKVLNRKLYIGLSLILIHKVNTMEKTGTVKLLEWILAASDEEIEMVNDAIENLKKGEPL